MPSKRWLTVAIALAAASLLAVSVQATSWWADGVTQVGPAASTSCFGQNCRIGDLSWAGSSTWSRAGAATHAGGLVTAIALVALAGALAARRGGKRIALAVMSGSLASLVAATVFIISRPDQITGTLRAENGAVLFVGGIVAAALAGWLALRASPQP